MNGIPEEYLPRARSLEEDLGVNELAWDRETAKALIRALGSRAVVLGGDVYFETSGQIRPAYANWSCERKSAESLNDYAARSQQDALRFVESFSDPPDASVYYVLVLTTEETAGY